MTNHAQLPAGGIAVLSGFLLAIILVALLMLISSQDFESVQPLSQQRTLVIAVPADFSEVMERTGVAFAATHRGARVRILHAAPDAVVHALRRRRVDLAVIAEGGQPLPADFHRIAIARDGISLVVHRSNSIALLSDTDIADLYTGRIKNWKTVGGEDMPVAVRKKSAGHQETERMLRYLGLENAARRADLALGDSEKLINQVAENPEAFGVSSVAVALRQIRLGHPVKLLALRGVPATENEIRRGRFPLIVTTFLVSGEVVSPLASSFLGFMQSGVAREILRSHAFIEP